MTRKRLCPFFILLLCALFLFSCRQTVDEDPGRVGKSHVSVVGEETAEAASGEVSSDPASPQTQEEPDPVISFIAAGDNIVHQCVIDDAAARAVSAFGEDSETVYYFDEMYDNVRSLIADADIAFVNQEGPTAGKSFGYTGYPYFNAPDEAGETLLNLGFDVVNIANNHMLDMDTVYAGTGYRHSIDYWKAKNVLMIGGYGNQEDYDTPRVLTCKGAKIAFLSYTYGTNGLTLNSGSPECIVPYIDDEDLSRQIAAAKKCADLVFVSMHWGNENTFTPTSEQKRLAQLCADCGADAVIGHHPHVIQPVEWVTGESGNRMLCVYSLGNFLHTMLNSYNILGGLVSFDIVPDNGGYTLDHVRFIPTVCHYLSDVNVMDNQDLPVRYGLSLYLLTDYTEKLCEEHGSQIYGAFTLDTLYDYVTDTVDAAFLDESILNR